MGMVPQSHQKHTGQTNRLQVSFLLNPHLSALSCFFIDHKYEKSRIVLRNNGIVHCHSILSFVMLNTVNGRYMACYAGGDRKDDMDE